MAKAKKSKDDRDDVTVAGPGTPISLDKVIECMDRKDNENLMVAEQPDGQEKTHWLKLFINNTGSGMAYDSDKVVNVLIEDRTKQAHHWRDHIWDGRRISAYLFRYLYWIYREEGLEMKKYPTDLSVAKAFVGKELTETSEEWIRVKNQLEWLKSNREVEQLVGLIQLVGGTLNLARKNNTGYRIFIEEPETGLHPTRERMVVCILQQLRREYGFDDDDKTKDTP